MSVAKRLKQCRKNSSDKLLKPIVLYICTVVLLFVELLPHCTITSGVYWCKMSKAAVKWVRLR